MRHCPTQAYQFLEARHPGLYHTLIRTTLAANGIIHSAPDCFCLAIPDPESPSTVIILFQCSHLPALWRLAIMYQHQFTHVRIRRDFKKHHYRERTIPLTKIIPKASLAAITSTPA